MRRGGPSPSCPRHPLTHHACTKYHYSIIFVIVKCFAATKMPTATPLLDVTRMRAAASGATAVLSTLANENRLLLLCQLSQGERSVGELAQQEQTVLVGESGEDG